MKTPLISCVTPSIRVNMLPVVAQSLKRQNFEGQFEWLIGSPAHLEKEIREVVSDMPFRFIPEPPARKGDFYNLSKCYNSMFREAKGELIVSIQDGIWFPNDVLSSFWYNFLDDKKRCVTAIGDQYAEMVNGKPEIIVWEDPRGKMDNNGSFYETFYTEMEIVLASFPREAIIACKGFQEVYDQGAACGEKAMFLRLSKLGFKMFIDKSTTYRALKHGRLGGSEIWDKHYQIACDLLVKHFEEIKNGRGLEGDL